MKHILLSILFLPILVAKAVGQDGLLQTSEVIVRTYQNSKWIPDSIFNLRIVAGKKIEVVSLNSKYVDLSTNNYRQALRTTPGIFVSEHDASGLQTSISTRGLSANRSWEFNMRQNGYDIAADPSGYSEAYYSPTLDAVAKIQVFRGSSALQYGSQFGGMINYQLKENIGERPIVYEGSQTAGSFGLFSSYNAIGGKEGAWTYYGFMHHRQAQGFRSNNRYFTNTYFAKLGYEWKGGNISAEYTNSYYLCQQTGGLHDTLISIRPDTSRRARNWFELPWKIASIQCNYQVNKNLYLQGNVNYLNGHRNSVGFLKPINIADTFNVNVGGFNPRDVDIDVYNTLSSEMRFNMSFSIGGKKQVLTGGLRYCLSDIHRLQKGIGTQGTDLDLTVVPDNGGKLFLRDLDLQTENTALFTEQLFHIGEKFSISPGFRAESIRSSISGRSNHVASGYISELSKNRCIFLGGISSKYSLVKTTNSNLTLYANANQNYRPVMYSELLPSSTSEIVDSSLSDMTGYSSEFGIKGYFLVRQVLINFDVNTFYIRYNNKVGTLHVHGAPFKTNIGDMESKGIEFYTEVTLMNPFFKNSSRTEQLNLYLSGTGMEARYKRWNNPAIANNELTSIAGKKSEYAPNHILRAGLEYKFKEFAFNYQINYTGSSFADAANTVNTNTTATTGMIPSLTLQDIGLSISLFDNYLLKLGVNNLFNEIRVVRRVGGYPGPGALTNQARSFYATLSIKI
jgi:Fe(3+) dicitrate transport protein